MGAESNFMLLWPDGMGDMQSSLGSWNCSRTDGPKGNKTSNVNIGWVGNTGFHY